MLCEVCVGEPKAVICQESNFAVLLACGHYRTAGLLPKNCGHIGLEDRDTKEGRLLFTGALPVYSNY